jgi:hypothetical protein
LVLDDRDCWEGRLPSVRGLSSSVLPGRVQQANSLSRDYVSDVGCRRASTVRCHQAAFGGTQMAAGVRNVDE